MNQANGRRHASDTYFLAMIRHRLGEKQTAKQLFEHPTDRERALKHLEWIVVVVAVIERPA